MRRFGHSRTTGDVLCRPAALVWLVALVLLVLLLVLPIRNTAIRSGIVLLAAALLAGCPVAFRSVFAGVVPAVALLLVLWVAFAPPRSCNPAQLREEYVALLERYAGARYVWGGETRLGIDCSGLVRCGLRDACLRRGIATADAGLVGQAAWLWWHDVSARSLGTGWEKRLQLLGEAPSLNEADYDILSPGDVAVSKSGVHALVYVGDHKWLQAEPGHGGVARSVAPDPSDPWFRCPMILLRWSCLRTDHIRPGDASRQATPPSQRSRGKGLVREDRWPKAFVPGRSRPGAG